MSAASEKSELRTRYRFERRERYLDHSFSYLATSSEFSKASAIASYISYGDEPKTEELNQALLKSGKDLYLPRVNGIGLEWVLWNGSSDQLAPSKLSKQLLEPTGASLTDLSPINLIVVPALRIDRSGYRLGQGGGFYDRLLAKPPRKTFLLGHGHAFQLVSRLPEEPHDIKVKAVATPQGVIRCRAR